MSWVRFKEINNVAKIYSDCSLKNLSHHKEEAQAFLKKPYPLLLQGKCGSGKTYFMMTLIRELFDQNNWPVWAVNFCKAKNMSDKMEEAFRSFGTTKAEVDKALESNCLFIDDFGVQGKSDRMERDFYEICDIRLGDMKPTVFSTNLGNDEIKQVFGARIHSRLKLCERIVFNGEDKRSFL